MAIRREVFDEVGVFDERISGRGDETEWFHRAGRVFRYDESLIIWHTREGATDQVARRGRVPAGPGHAARDGADRRLAAGAPRLARVPRFLAHAVRRRCVNGLLQASRELGALRGSWACAGRAVGGDAGGPVDVPARRAAGRRADRAARRDRRSS